MKNCLSLMMAITMGLLISASFIKTAAASDSTIMLMTNYTDFNIELSDSSNRFDESIISNIPNGAFIIRDGYVSIEGGPIGSIKLNDDVSGIVTFHEIIIQKQYGSNSFNPVETIYDADIKFSDYNNGTIIFPDGSIVTFTLSDSNKGTITLHGHIGPSGEITFLRRAMKRTAEVKNGVKISGDLDIKINVLPSNLSPEFKLSFTLPEIPNEKNNNYSYFITSIGGVSGNEYITSLTSSDPDTGFNSYIVMGQAGNLDFNLSWVSTDYNSSIASSSSSISDRISIKSTMNSINKSLNTVMASGICKHLSTESYNDYFSITYGPADNSSIDITLSNDNNCVNFTNIIDSGKSSIRSITAKQLDDKYVVLFDSSSNEIERKSIGYYISFNTLGGSPIKSIVNITDGKTVTAPIDPDKEGCIFIGWYTDEGYANKWDFSTPVTGNITLYARWSDKPAPSPFIDMPESAVKSTVANALNKLGLFSGIGTDAGGAPNYALDKKLTRLEALALVIRLMGHEDLAKAYTGANTFTDIPAWGDRYAAYAYHAGITTGVNSGHTLFAPDRPVTFQEFTAMILRVLGYTEANGDFVFEQAIQKGIDIGLFNLFDISKFSTGDYIRGHAVLEIANALQTKQKNDDMLLIYKLVNYGVLTKTDADWFLDNIKIN